MKSMVDLSPVIEEVQRARSLASPAETALSEDIHQLKENLDLSQIREPLEQVRTDVARLFEELEQARGSSSVTEAAMLAEMERARRVDSSTVLKEIQEAMTDVLVP